MKTPENRRDLVWELMSDGRWHSTMEINSVHVGGSEGCRRLRELRREVRKGKRLGWVDIDKRKKAGDTTQYEYRLVAATMPRRFPVPKKGQQSLF